MKLQNGERDHKPQQIYIWHARSEILKRCLGWCDANIYNSRLQGALTFELKYIYMKVLVSSVEEWRSGWNENNLLFGWLQELASERLTRKSQAGPLGVTHTPCHVWLWHIPLHRWHGPEAGDVGVNITNEVPKLSKSLMLVPQAFH